jgi:hypothetical protein
MTVLLTHTVANAEDEWLDRLQPAKLQQFVFASTSESRFVFLIQLRCGTAEKGGHDCSCGADSGPPTVCRAPLHG